MIVSLLCCVLMFYSKTPDKKEKAAHARGSHLRIHYKHCREIAHAINGMQLAKAKDYLEKVLQFKAAIPFTKYTGGIGRHAMAKAYKVPGDKVSWPQKATRTFLDLLTNIGSNASAKGLDVEKVKITHANVNQAPKMRRRTYRAHGRINAYMSSPAHINIIGEETSDEVAKAAEPAASLLSRKQQAQKAAAVRRGKVAVGGGH
jgi:large subunit ribosomal protein L17e